MKKLETSKEIKLIALKARREACARGEEFVWNEIRTSAAAGNFRAFIYKIDNDTEITISAEFVKELKNKGFKVSPRDRYGWDDLHRYYKGAIIVTWRR